MYIKTMEISKFKPSGIMGELLFEKLLKSFSQHFPIIQDQLI